MGRSHDADGSRPTTKESGGGETGRPQEKGKTTIKKGRLLRGM